MTLALPAPIAAYFAADRAHDADGVARAFAAGAHVHDERHDYHGREAIRAWMVASWEKYRATTEPLAVTESAEGTTVRARLSGNFPGSPVEVDFQFTLADGVISTLEVH